MKRKISIYDIAKYSNVSPAAVSYVINGKKKVSDATREKVLQAIKELNYVPDHTARSLSTGKSHLIGLFLPLSETSDAFLSNPFYVEFIGGLSKGIAGHDYDIVIASLKNENNFIDWAKSRAVDGIVMLGKYPKKIYDDIKELNIPVVLTDVYEDYSSEFHNIRVNDEDGMYLATKHLIDLGHKEIGFVGAWDISLIDYQRYLGYLKAMKEANLTVNDEHLFFSFATFDYGQKAADEIIKRNNVSAVVCSADIISIGIIRRYIEHGRKVPDDLSIVGFDDIQDSKFIYPSLTTIKQDIALKGAKAAEIIVRNINESCLSSSLTVLDTKLVIRESTKEVK